MSELSSLQPRLAWNDVEWHDPDGGRVILHGTIPTMVYPRALRPEIEYHGLALLESPEVVELWEQEEKDEAESQGVNLAHALISGGAFAIYLDELTVVDNITVGRFPDPEPRRIHRNSVRHDRPVYFIEPTADDEQWGEHLLKEAKVVSHWRKLLGMISIGGKWRKRVKKNIFEAKKPPKGVDVNHGSASVLAATWWDLQEWLIGPKISLARNQRFAKRLRGALADLREVHGDDATLLVAMHHPWRNDILTQLESLPSVEEISSSTDDSSVLEEE